MCVCGGWGTVKMKTITHPHPHASASQDEPCERLEGDLDGHAEGVEVSERGRWGR